MEIVISFLLMIIVLVCLVLVCSTYSMKLRDKNKKENREE